jgi:hypothetical protein
MEAPSRDPPPRQDDNWRQRWMAPPRPLLSAWRRIGLLAELGLFRPSGGGWVR